MVLFSIFILLLFFSVVESLNLISNKVNRFNFFISVIILSVFLFFRYGQGVDYFNYIYAIETSSSAIEDLLKYGDFSNRFEYGFSLLSYFFLSILQLPTEYAISIISLGAFIPIALYINKYSARPNLSLLFYFSFFFLIYSYSGIRQGLCLGIFIYFILPLLKNKQWIKYYILVLLLSTIHSSSFILTLLPLFLLFKLNRYTIFLFILASAIVGFFVMPSIINSIFGSFGESGELASSYLSKEESGFDFISLILRLIIFLLIYIAYVNKNNRSGYDDFLFKVYIFGLLIYFIFVSNSLLSSRFSIYFRITEIVLIVNVFVAKNITRLSLMKHSFVFIISIVMYIKSVNTELILGEYKNNITFYQIPYVSVFNQRDIFLYRSYGSFLDAYFN